MKYSLHDLTMPTTNLEVRGGPMFNTTLFSDSVGDSQAQENWDEALWHYTVQFVRGSSAFVALRTFFLGRRGAGRAFWYDDLLDNTDGGHGEVKTLNGVRYLVKNYADSVNPYYRIIRGGTGVAFSGVTGSPVYTPGTGIITGATSDGTATFGFKVPVAFASDFFELGTNSVTGTWDGVMLREIRSFSIAS